MNKQEKSIVIARAMDFPMWALDFQNSLVLKGIVQNPLHSPEKYVINFYDIKHVELAWRVLIWANVQFTPELGGENKYKHFYDGWKLWLDKTFWGISKVSLIKAQQIILDYIYVLALQMEVMEKDSDQLAVGQELDELIAEKIMGWRYSNEPTGGATFWQNPEKGFVSGYLTPKEYSLYMRYAWEVVEKLAQQGMTMHLEWKGSDRNYPLTAEVTFSKGWTAGWAVADTAPHAICLAALQTLREKR
jgi:hypothetical protein